MLYRIAADMLVILHFAFIVFVVLGGLLVWRWPKLVWLHLPMVLWAIGIECAGFICPLTPLENFFRDRAGSGGYEGGFIEHYIVTIIYPQGLTRTIQFVLAALLVAINIVFYLLMLRGHRKKRDQATITGE